MKGTEPAFPDDKNHIGIDTLTYITVEMAKANRICFPMDESDAIAKKAIKDAFALIKHISIENSPKSHQGSLQKEELPI